MTTRAWERLSILMIGLSVIGACIYLINRVVSSSFMELAHKLAM